MKNSTTYYRFVACQTRIQLHEGGTRSGKTYGIVQGLIELCYHNAGAAMVISIVRKTFPSLRATVYRDFVDILTAADWYDISAHDRTNHTYQLFGNLVEFFSVDQYEKVKGRKRHVLFVNEATDLALQEWRQLVLRTTWRIVADYNPEPTQHWLYDQVATREDCTTYHSTYKDNPHLPPEVIQEIELLREQDPEYWAVYDLGQRGKSRDLVFVHQNIVDEIPAGYRLVRYGFDDGFAISQLAVAAVYSNGHGYLLDEVLYGVGLDASDVAQAMRGREPAIIVADPENPRMLRDLRKFGMTVVPIDKPANSRQENIRTMQSRPLLILRSATNLVKEFDGYKYLKDQDGQPSKIPEKKNDHLIDAAMYAKIGRAHV